MPHSEMWLGCGLRRNFTGIVTGSEIVESNLLIHGDQRFGEIRYVINDFSKVDDCLVSEEDLHLLSITDGLATHANHYLKIALIVTRERLLSLAQDYCELMRSAAYDAQIFNNREDAQIWVDSSFN